MLLPVLHLMMSLESFAQPTVQPIHIGFTDTVHATATGETRVINIYLPESYKAEDSVHYPVIYIPDGGLEEDFFHIAGLVRFNSQPWINRLPPSIVVGIENINRRRDFTFAVTNTDFIEKEGFKKSQFPLYGKSAEYIRFISKDLFPYIEKNYRVNNNRTIIGESLAGLLAAEILLQHTELFNQYIIVSPSLWWGGRILLNDTSRWLLQKTSANCSVYIGAPSKKEDKKMYNDAYSFYRLLQKHVPQLFFDYLPSELHSTVLHQAVYNAIKKLHPQTLDSK